MNEQKICCGSNNILFRIVASLAVIFGITMGILKIWGVEFDIIDKQVFATVGASIGLIAALSGIWLFHK